VRDNLPDFPRGEVLAMEKELLGLYLSEHPVRHFEPILRRKHRALALSGLKETQNGQQVVIGGMVTSVRTHYTKKGEPMLFVTLEDTSGAISVTCFPQATSRLPPRSSRTP
jgi:DNA polymerase-3 subunit alpha